MDTLYLLINEPSVANPERASTNTKATLTDKKDAEENKERKVNPDGWMVMGRRKERRKTSPSLQLLQEEKSNTSSFPATQITFSKPANNRKISCSTLSNRYDEKQED